MTKKKLFIVDTVVTYRMRYVIEAETLEHAFDEVTMRDSGNPDDEFEEFSQKCLGEQIIDGRKLPRRKFQKLLDELAESGDGSHWMGEQLIRTVKYD